MAARRPQRRDIDPALSALRSAPGRAGVFVDFDGTLAPIVDVPSAAEPHRGAAEVLDALAGAGFRVVAVSGRPVAFLEQHLPASIDLAGVYGLEWRSGGRAGTHPDVAPFAPVVAETAARAEAELPAGTTVESKGLSLTLHYRQAPGAADAVEQWAAAAAERTGLEARRAKASVELHPKVDADKGRVILERSEGLAAALYAGDDLGDLPAYDALDVLEDRGLTTLRVACAGAEAPPELVRRADVVVDEPAALVDFLRRLLPTSAGT